MAEDSPTLADLLDVNAQLRRDEAVNDRDLRVRDRAIGKQLDARASPAAHVLSWLQRVENGDSPRLGERADAARRIAVALLIGLGLVLGWVSALALFHYDGDDPVNVVHVLGVYVALQAVLVMLTIGAMLPLGRAVRDALSVLSPGRLVPLLARVLPRDYRDALEQALGRLPGGAHRRVYGRLQKWLFLLAAQGFAVAFNIGALAGAMQLIIGTDLAFGWSTTLQASDQQFTAIVQTLALPWGWLWSDARPTLELVEATRYFRAQPALTGELERFGHWWPFLVMCLLTYGLLPRVVLGVVARFGYTAALRHALLTTPGVAQLLDRLDTQVVNHTSPASSASSDGSTDTQPATVDSFDASQSGDGALPGAGVGVVINWSDVPVDDAALQSPTVTAPILHAGGARSIDEDRQAIATAAKQRTDRKGVLIVVRAWEPPMLELVDFIVELREAIGEGVPIAVAPLRVERQPGPGTARLASGNESELHQWRSALTKANDPWLRVVVWEGGQS